MASDRIYVCIDADDKERVKRYLDATYKGSMSSLCYRLLMEKVMAWEERQARNAS